MMTMAPPTTRPPPGRPPARVLQRKCECGATSPAIGTCKFCADKENPLQRKLAVGASNDPLEREADRVADQVLAAPAGSDFASVPLRIQRSAQSPASASEAVPSSVDRALAAS